MRTDLNKSDGLITAVATNHVPTAAAKFDHFVTLAFWQNGSIVTLFLPAKMAACASMIAGAFNAHMAAEPGVGVREQVARGNAGGAGGYGGVAIISRHGSVTDHGGGGSSAEDDAARRAAEGTNGHEHPLPD